MNLDFPDGSDSEESACKAADPSSIPGSERCPGEGSDELSGILTSVNTQG